jgi:hypothetical protein
LDEDNDAYAEVRNGTYLNIPLKEGDHNITLDSHLTEHFFPVTVPGVRITRDKKTFLKFVPDSNHVGTYTWTTDSANESDRAKVAPIQIKK